MLSGVPLQSPLSKAFHKFSTIFYLLFIQLFLIIIIDFYYYYEFAMLKIELRASTVFGTHFSNEVQLWLLFIFDFEVGLCKLPRQSLNFLCSSRRPLIFNPSSSAFHTAGITTAIALSGPVLFLLHSSNIKLKWKWLRFEVWKTLI